MTTSGVRAVARIRAVADGRGGTALPVLAGEGPLALRRSRGGAVILVGAMSAPLGGDRLRIEADVGAGARLVVGAAAATVALPGRDGEPASYDIRLTVGEDAALRWLPEPLISARGSSLRMTTRVELAATARLLLRDEQILGRHAEPPGDLATRLTVQRDGRPLLDQELSFGPGAPAWSGPAVLGPYRAVGQLLLVDPDLAGDPAKPQMLTDSARDGRAMLTPLAGPALLVTAVAADGLRLRRLLDQGLGAARDR
ncbi:urease accessory protein [Streptomyces sp. DvalAA-14]|uniref:urease accessory protein UreD n=1 Tax=unclassified Streptomyces TaxID=2593676 RepID=UPI00081BAD31|nr:MULTISPECIES: urease accessory protein UreD [unclassified Streptomyces]MYS21502.1 urease accessory protein UreD [Streptomyces sp. SID4948]SCD94274.1 urease accessory protein [Streptomyces sp. DvalAA-14]